MIGMRRLQFSILRPPFVVGKWMISRLMSRNRSMLCLSLEILVMVPFLGVLRRLRG